jgi:hypothetical protein
MTAVKTVEAQFASFEKAWNERADRIAEFGFGKAAVKDAIEKAKNRNGWALSTKSEITWSHEKQMVVVWTADGDYDAWYEEGDIDGIQNELLFIEANYEGEQFNA